MLQTTTGSCTRKYAQAQNQQQRRHKIRNTSARNVKNAQQRRHKRATVKNAQPKLQACDGKTRASV